MTQPSVRTRIAQVVNPDEQATVKRVGVYWYNNVWDCVMDVG